MNQNAVRYGGLLGLSLAVTALIKPFSIGLPLVFVMLAVVRPISGPRRSRIVFSACILIAYAATIAPWEIWARHVGGHWIPLCTNGANVLIDGLAFGTERGLPQIALPEGARALVAMQLPSTRSSRALAALLISS